MEQFNTIPTSGNWSDIAAILDTNFLRCYTALVQAQSLIGLDGSNYMGMYASASALPDDMTEAGWALVGSSLSALQLYVFNDGATDWALFSNDTYNFTSWTEFQTQLNALSTQVTQIGLKIGNLSELETTDKSDLVSAINEVKAATDDLSGNAADISYIDNKGLGSTNVQGALDELAENVNTISEDLLIKFPIDINSIDEYTNTYIIIASGKWSRTNTNSFFAMEVNEGDTYRVVANDNSDATLYAFLKDLTRSSGATPNYADGETNRHFIPQGSSEDITIPATTKYLYFGGYNNDMDMYYSPKELYKLEELNPYVKSLSNEVNEIKLVNGGKTTFGELANPSYIIIASGKWSSSTTNHSAYFKEVEEGEVYRFLGNATTNGFYAFLKDKTTSKSGTPNYADGENGRYAIPIGVETENIIIPATTKYLYICNTNAGIDQKPQAIYSIIPINNATENLVSDVEEIKDVLGMGGDGETSGFSYYGEKIAFSNTMNFSSYATNAIAGQSSAIYGDYLFIVKDKLTSITCYNMATKTLLYTLTTGYSKGSNWHCNQSQFGTLRVNENDVFPVLYITVNNDSNGRCSWVAYRIIPTYTDNEISSFTIEEVQTIYLPAMTDDNCLGNVNIAVDYERNLLCGYGRNNNSQAANYSKARFVCFPMPALTETTVTYEDADIIDTFQDDWNMAYAQGGFIKNGKLVIMQGYASVNLINLRVIDLYGQRRQVTYADLLGNGFTQEPEGVFYYKGSIYTSANSTTIWRISIG